MSIYLYEEILQHLIEDREIELTPIPKMLLPPVQKESATTAAAITPEEMPTLRRIKALLSESLHVPVDDVREGSVLRALGVDSISAIQISFKARRDGLDMSASDFSRCRTVADLTKLASRANEGAKGTPTLETAVSDRLVDGSEAALTPGMQWFVGAWQASGGTRYRHAFAYRSKRNQRLDRAELKMAWFKLLERHSILRKCIEFSAEKGASLISIPSTDQTWTEEQIYETIEETGWLAQRMQELVVGDFSKAAGAVKALFVCTPSHDYFVMGLHHYQYGKLVSVLKPLNVG